MNTLLYNRIRRICVFKKIVSFVLVVIAVATCSTVGQAATYQKGDVNKDGNINIFDVTLIQIYIAGDTLANFTLYYADFNGDGSITVNDISAIQLYMAKQLFIYNDFFYTVANNTATITNYRGTAKKLSVPNYMYTDKQEAIKVTAIGDKALYGKYQLTEVTIADNIRKIGDYAFANCKNLTTVTIKNDKCHIDSSSFENCPISSFKFG